jgi:hypothetical protein
VVVIVPSFFLTAYTLLLYGVRPHFFDGDLVAVAREIRAASDRDFPRILSGVRASRRLAVLSPGHVYAGHWSLTPGYDGKRSRLVAAGFTEPDDSIPAATGDKETFAEVLAESLAEFVVIHRAAPALRIAEGTPGCTVLKVVGDWVIVRHQASPVP